MSSHSFENRASLPGKTSTLDTSEVSRGAFNAAGKKQATTRASSMVEQDRPTPQPRPSPGLAHEVDRQSFNQRWEAEQREARKAAFIQMRTDPETGGQVRSLHKTFNR